MRESCALSWLWEPGSAPAQSSCAAEVWLRRRQSGVGSSFLMLVLCFWLTISATAMVRADTLAEAMASAYETNPTLLAARKQLAGVDEQVAQALSFWRPRADVVAGGGYIKDLSGEDESTRTANTQFSTTDGPTAVLNLEVRQPIYNFLEFSESEASRGASSIRAGAPHRGRAGCAASRGDRLSRSVPRRSFPPVQHGL